MGPKLVVGAAVLLVLLFPAVVHSGTVAFVSDRDGNAEIYVMDEAGGNQRRLTNDSGRDFHPEFSPDGKRIAFISDRGGSWRIYTMDLDGGNLTEVANTQGVVAQTLASGDALSWSPDGSRILFRPNRNSVGSIRPDGSDLQVYFSTGVPDHTDITGINWGPTANDIYLNANPISSGFNQHIFHYLVDAGTFTQITADPGLIHSQAPDVSPDGSLLAFHRALGHQAPKNIWILDRDDPSNETQLTFHTGWTQTVDPCWLASTGQILYSSDITGTHQIYVMDGDGGNQTRFFGAGNNYSASWSAVDLAAVPLPAGAWTGLSLLGALGLWRRRAVTRRSNRSA